MVTGLGASEIAYAATDESEFVRPADHSGMGIVSLSFRRMLKAPVVLPEGSWLNAIDSIVTCMGLFCEAKATTGAKLDSADFVREHTVFQSVCTTIISSRGN